jgi:RNA polymerase sigma factor (sigma-70 family)
MTTSQSVIAAVPSDAELVQRSASGSSEAFAEIVARYQTLICSLTYSRTGSFNRSEDIAQEVFLTAWKELRQLREPSKLQAWLCGIARRRIANTLRREEREPACAAEELDAERASVAPDPAHDTITREEEAILWRALEQVPETYREPLVLFYREGESVARVADALELSEDAAKQRLSRGRRMLQDQVALLVEGVLRQSAPGHAFTLAVITSLPLMATSAAAASIGATVAQGTAGTKGAGLMGTLGSLLGPVAMVILCWFSHKATLDMAPSERARHALRGFARRLMAASLLFVGLLITAMFVVEEPPSVTYMVVIYLTIVGVIAARFIPRYMRMYEEEQLRDPAAFARHFEAWRFEYVSKWRPLGLPLVNVKTGGWKAPGEKLPRVRGWIAVGPIALGVLCSVGPIAIGGIAIGGVSLGLVSIGFVCVGGLAFGGLAVGVWGAAGWLAMGFLAHGSCALAWKAAQGGWVAAQEFAIGGSAHAPHANDATAKEAMASMSFFRAMATIKALWAAWPGARWLLLCLPFLLTIAEWRRARRRLNAAKG